MSCLSTTLKVLASCALILTGASGCTTPRASGIHKTNRPFLSQADGRVSMGQSVNIGEVSQYIDISGRDEHQPVLLYLHGGPGRSAIPSAHVYAESLERHYVVVHWDQRGTQRSFSEELQAFPLNFERLVADTLELSSLLADWFERERIVLVAEGGAALAALKAADLRPEAFHALVLVSPFVERAEALIHGYNWALDKAHESQRRDALLALQAMGSPPWEDGLALNNYKVLGDWLDRLGGTVPSRDAARMRRDIESAAPAGRRVRSELALQGEAYSLERLWSALSTQEIARQHTSVHVPLFIVAGRDNQRVPMAHVERYYEALDAKRGKTLVQLDGVGHWPLLEAPERVIELLVSRVWSMAR